MAQLVLPSNQYKASFLQAAREYQQEQLPHYLILDLAALEKDFEGFVKQLENESKGQNLPEGYVPHTTYWLVEGEEFVGRVDIRHYLNPSLKGMGGNIGYDVRPSQRRKGYGKLILELALQKAKELGLKDVVVSCDVTNIGSNKIVQANGGKLLEIKPRGTGIPDKARYTITLSV